MLSHIIPPRKKNAYDRKLEAIAGRILKLTGMDWHGSLDVAHDAVLRFLKRVKRDGGDMDVRLMQLVTNKLDKKYLRIWFRYLSKTMGQAVKKRFARRETQFENNGENLKPDRVRAIWEEGLFTEKELVTLFEVFGAYPDGQHKELLELLLCEGSEQFKEMTKTKRMNITLKLAKQQFGWDEEAFEMEKLELLHALCVKIEDRIAEREQPSKLAVDGNGDGENTSGGDVAAGITLELKGSSLNGKPS